MNDDRVEGDDQERSDDAVDPEAESDAVSTGDPLETLFEVETVGEAEPSHEDDMTDPGPAVDPDFTVEPQTGEEMPPELEHSDLEAPASELDPTDPTDAGMTADVVDLEEPGREASGPTSDGPGLGPFDGLEPPGREEMTGFDDVADPADPGAVDVSRSPEDAGSEDGFAVEDVAPETPWRDWSRPTVPPDVESAPPAPERPAPDEPADWASFTDETYVRSSTSEYLGLAEELARAAGEDVPEQSAVSAGIPGLETGIVGLDDVVGADNVEVIPLPPAATDLGLRLLTAIGLLVLFGLSLLSSTALTVLATIVFGLAAGEYYAVLVRAGLHPLSIFGLLGVAGALVGTALWGLAAIPVAVIATLVAVALFYALASPRPDSGTNAGLTVMVVGWIALGAFAFPIIDHPDYRLLILAAVAVVVVMDAAQYFIGRRFGSRPMAPLISPNKTIEGFIGGSLVAVIVAIALSFLGPLTLTSMLLLVAATIVLAPVGDLSVSLVKRIVGVKDMGTVLPGHGGILDRIDGLLFVLPAAWLVFEATGLLA